MRLLGDYGVSVLAVAAKRMGGIHDLPTDPAAGEVGRLVGSGFEEATARQYVAWMRDLSYLHVMEGGTTNVRSPLDLLEEV